MDVEGFEVPLHRALVEPILLGGAPRAVAIVNGTPIERGFYDFYAKGFAGKSSMSEVTPEQRQQALDNLIHAQVVAQEARKEGIDKDPATASVLRIEELKVLQDALSEKYLQDQKPTEQEMRAERRRRITPRVGDSGHPHATQALCRDDRDWICRPLGGGV